MDNQNLDQNQVGLNVVGFLIPIVGLILYLVFQKDQPIKAAGIGKWSLIGFAFNLFLIVFL